MLNNKQVIGSILISAGILILLPFYIWGFEWWLVAIGSLAIAFGVWIIERDDETGIIVRMVYWGIGLLALSIIVFYFTFFSELSGGGS